jgi:flagellar protein FlgJ
MVDEVRAFVSHSARAEPSALERIDRRSSLEEVAQQFEAIFVNELMKASRAAKLSEDILSNSGTQPFLEMMDQEFSQTISKRNSLGIAEALVQQFERK